MRRLYDQLLMRQLRIANSQLRKAGTRAIVLEGDSGIGKSVLVIETLRALGYTELTKDSPSCSNGKHYYYLTPTDLEEMETILIKAFHEGAIVVVDELNTLSPLEALLNDLLSGRYKNQPAQQEGFMLIGTQNPANKYKNRKILSKALANRARVETIDNYPVEELEEIVTAITHDLDTAKKETQTFEIAKNYATAFHKHPEPTPRDLCRKTKLLSANTRMEIENDAATTVFTT
ncbi:MAG: AAA family ATPase [Coxiellaceae bacterium]|nr:MAG: AAA family ATPase [Coxiellaceae bacterium]